MAEEIPVHKLFSVMLIVVAKEVYKNFRSLVFLVSVEIRDCTVWTWSL